MPRSARVAVISDRCKRHLQSLRAQRIVEQRQDGAALAALIGEAQRAAAVRIGKRSVVAAKESGVALVDIVGESHATGIRGCGGRGGTGRQTRAIQDGPSVLGSRAG